MRRLASISLLGVLILARAAGSSPQNAATSPGSDPDESRIADAVAGELRSLHASTAADLVEGAPARPLITAGSFALEHGDGRGRIVVLGLAPGSPVYLGVMSYFV
jgi:hypothetical protein